MLKAAKRPMIVRRQGALARDDGAAVLAMAARARRQAAAPCEDGWNGFNVLHTAAARVGGLDLGFVPGEGGRDVAGIGAAREARDRRALSAGRRRDRHQRSSARPSSIYQGSHGDAGAHRADVILPGAAYTEKHGLYVNTEGRVQLRVRAGLSAGRSPGGLGDPARPVGAPRQDAALRHARPVARAGWWR